MATQSTEQGGAPSWLFSFVDLAFLMLIAMTLLASEHVGDPDLGEIVVPRVGEDASKDLGRGTGQAWQLRVHPPVEDAYGELEPPFELVVVASFAAPASGERLDRDTLVARLAELKESSGDKPLLAPHEDSRSQDFLDAASAIEDHWPTRRRALIARITDR